MGTTKYKIFKVTLSEDNCANLREGILLNRYSQANLSGFMVDKATSFEIEGAYVVSETISETITLPDGQEITFDRPAISIAKFRISLAQPQFIELINPPRSIRPLISKLEFLCNFSLTIEPLKIEIKRFSEEAQEILGELNSYKVSIQSISLSEQTIATANIRSSKDAIHEAQLVFGDRDFKIAKASFKNEKGKVEVTSNGCLTISDGAFKDSVDDLIRIFVK